MSHLYLAIAVPKLLNSQAHPQFFLRTKLLHPSKLHPTPLIATPPSCLSPLPDPPYSSRSPSLNCLIPQNPILPHRQALLLLPAAPPNELHLHPALLLPEISLLLSSTLKAPPTINSSLKAPPSSTHLQVTSRPQYSEPRRQLPHPPKPDQAPLRHAPSRAQQSEPRPQG